MRAGAPTAPGTCPASACVGDSQDEVWSNSSERAVAFHLHGLREAGEPVPEPTAVGTTRAEVPAA